MRSGPGPGRWLLSLKHEDFLREEPIQSTCHNGFATTVSNHSATLGLLNHFGNEEAQHGTLVLPISKAWMLP